MKLAVNYSTPLDHLLRQNLIETDLIKCPDWQGVVNAALKLRPVCVHFDINIGLGRVSQLEPQSIQQLMKITATPHLNCHFAALTALDKNRASDRRVLVNNWKNELKILKEDFPEYRLVAENLPGEPYSAEYSIACMPELISEALNETETGFLLDLSHAMIAARNSHQELDRYLEKFPLQRLQELHITGVKPYRGFLTDHFELTTQDWEVVRWAKAQIERGYWPEPEIVAFEYGGIGEVFGWRCREEVLFEQVPVLYQLFSQSALNTRQPFSQ